jgi:hypothetical protein
VPSSDAGPKSSRQPKIPNQTHTIVQKYQIDFSMEPAIVSLGIRRVLVLTSPRICPFDGSNGLKSRGGRPWAADLPPRESGV